MVYTLGPQPSALLPMGFLKLTSLWLLALIPPLVVLYFLKLKRQKLAVPSLVLWKQVLNDNRVNSPFQRFKRNILLWLQLALLLLLILAAMEPFLRGGPSASDRLPILIDRSASMAAVDDKGKSRLDLAKEAAKKLITGMNPDEEVALIAFGKSAKQLADFTSNKRVLLNALDEIAIEDTPSDVTDALRMADAMARSTAFTRVLMISDGNFPEKIDFELPFKLDYQRLPAAGGNMGITALNARRIPGSGDGGSPGAGGGWMVFVNVQATEDAKGAATVELVQDGVVRGTERIAPIPGAGQRVIFNLATDRHTSIEVRLRPDGFDSLSSDNTAYLELSPPRPLYVYVPKSLGAYRSALKAVGDIQLDPPEAGGEASRDEYDLIVTDKAEDAGLPKDTTYRTALHVGHVPTELATLITTKQESTAVIDWRRTHPLLEHVELSEVVLLDQARRTEGTKEEDLENLHYEVIAHGRHGPLILQKREGQRMSYILLFHTDRSTLPYRVGFPIMLSNLVRQSMQDAGLLEVAGDRTGVLPPLLLTAGGSFDVEGPAEFKRKEKADDRGMLSGVPAPRVGQYVVKSGGTERKLGVSLLSSGETLLQSVEKITFAEGAVAATTAPAETNRSLWWLFALLALGFLVVEWWFFQRKPGGFTR